MRSERELHPEPTKTSTELSGMATSAIQQFKPINNIKTYLNGLHGYADNPKRQVIVDHFCGHLNEDVRQCVIYDSADESTARLIGVEYIISRKLFEQLPDDEKKYWHSHAYEVRSGLLVMPRVPHALEKPELSKLADTYGKTLHFWQVDKGDPLPYGEAKLMCSFTSDSQVNKDLILQRDQKLGINTEKIRQLRVEIEAQPVHPLADQFLRKFYPE